MSDDLHAEAYRELQREYLAELPTTIADLRKNIEAFRHGEDVVAELRTGFHRLAGSGGSYGFPEISEIARAAEQSVASSSQPAGSDRLDEAVRRLEAALTVARAQVAAGTDVARTGLRAVSSSRRRGPGPGDGGARRRRIRRGPAGPHRGSAHGDRRPASGSPGDRHRSGRGRPFRRRLLVDQPPLHPAARGDSDRDTQGGGSAPGRGRGRGWGVPRGTDGGRPAGYARTLAQSGPPPSTVLLLDGDADRSSRVVGVLELANIRVVRSPSAKAARELLDREVPDLLATAPRLADGDGFSVLRDVRGTRDSTCCRRW